MPWTAKMAAPSARQLSKQWVEDRLFTLFSLRGWHTWPTPGQEAAGPESRISRTWSWSCRVCRTPPSAVDSCRQMTPLLCHAFQPDIAWQLLHSNLSSRMPGFRVTARRCSISKAVSLMHKLLKTHQVCAAGHRHCRHSECVRMPNLGEVQCGTFGRKLSYMQTEYSSRWQTAAPRGNSACEAGLQPS